MASCDVRPGSLTAPESCESNSSVPTASLHYIVPCKTFILAIHVSYKVKNQRTMHMHVHFLRQNWGVWVLCQHSGCYVRYCIVFNCQNLLCVGCTDVALTFWQVFEQFLLAEESRKICRKLLIYTNRVQDLMLLVFVHDTSHIKQVSDEMNEFFTSGDGAKCKVTSMHVKVMKNKYVYCLLGTYWEGRVTRIQLGRVCAASFFDDIVLRPWSFMMFPPCQFWR